jgi:hypothetical protein
MFLDFGELETAPLSQPMIVAEDSGEVGQKRGVALPGRLVVTRRGGPVRHRVSGLQGGQVRPAEDLGAVVGPAPELEQEAHKVRMALEDYRKALYEAAEDIRAQMNAELAGRAARGRA